MYVCLCYGITDSAIQQAICDGSTSLNCLQEKLRVGTCCGCCVQEVTQMLEKSEEKTMTPISMQAA